MLHWKFYFTIFMFSWEEAPLLSYITLAFGEVEYHTQYGNNIYMGFGLEK